MISFKNRFHGHNSVRYVYSNGQVVRGRILTCKYAQNSRRKAPRIAVVISKKIHKSAVTRNRVRRRIYESVRLRIDSLSPKTDIVFIVGSADAYALTPSQLDELVDSIFTQANLYKTPKN